MNAAAATSSGGFGGWSAGNGSASLDPGGGSTCRRPISYPGCIASRSATIPYASRSADSRYADRVQPTSADRVSRESHDARTVSPAGWGRFG